MYEIATDSTALPWSPSGFPGVFMKPLDPTASGGGMTALMRMTPGSVIPAHRHDATDQTVYVVDGDLVDDGTTYGPGTFLVAKAGAPHGPHSTTGGCVLLTSYSSRPDFVVIE